MKNVLLQGDAVEILRTLPDNSVDSVVTDPPYGLGFMGKEWDKPENIAFNPHFWAECLRVLKPGGHLLAFSGTRTYHRMAVAIEDARFEIRDMIEWLYLSGFPKSMDVGKAFDKHGGSLLASNRFSEAYAKIVADSSFTHAEIDRVLGIKSSSCYWARTDHRGGMPPRHHWETVKTILNLSNEYDALYDEAERETIGRKTVNGAEGTAGGYKDGIASLRVDGNGAIKREVDITAPATDLAKQWDGWGTALKPAHEPIVMARKPIEKTVAYNVEKYGTGAVNVDGCRIGRAEDDRFDYGRDRELPHANTTQSMGKFEKVTPYTPHDSGRFPANCVTLDADEWYSKYFNVAPQEVSKKASKRDRGEGNTHPTVKPTDLMSWLVRLVTPPHGVVLDPFAGSGSTLVAAKREGFQYIGIELQPEYVEIAKKRLGEESE